MGSSSGRQRGGPRFWPRLLACTPRTSQWLVATVAAASFVLGTGPAQAAILRSPTPGSGELQDTTLQRPGAIAVDRASGDVFVGDRGTGYVNVYDSSGSLLTRFGGKGLLPAGVAVDELTGRVYVADVAADAVDVFRPEPSGDYTAIGEWSGAAIAGGGFGEVTGVAVDNSAGPSAGDIYIVDADAPETGAGAVDVFKPAPPGPQEGTEGALARSLTKGGLEEPNGVAVDPQSGRVYVADSVKGAVVEFSATGAIEGKLTGSSSPLGTFAGKEQSDGNVTAVAVDPTSGHLLVAERDAGVVSEFDESGQWVGWITSTALRALAAPAGVAAGATGGAYVSDSAPARVDLYGPGLPAPDVATGKASKPTRVSTQLVGTLDGLGETGHVFFEWGTSPALGASTTPTVFSGGQEPILASLSGLSPETTYYYRIAAEGENGTSVGATRQFTTPPAVENVSTSAATGLQPESAIVNGSLSPNGVQAHYYFQWGTTTLYGKTTPAPPGTVAGEGKETVHAEAELAGLTPNTVYHYRLVAQNSFGKTYGSDRVLRTAGPPTVSYNQPAPVGHETATLNATVDPGELETNYRFEYGETAAYGEEAPSGGGSVPAGAEGVGVSAGISGLKIGTVYHYRVVATNSAGATIGPDETFQTQPPSLIKASATGVNETEAKLKATINPLGSDTTYYFEYGTAACSLLPNPCSASPAPPGADIGEGEEPVSVTLPLAGLVPGTTYHYRIVATSTLGTTTSTERSFTTLAASLPDARAWEMVSPPDKGAAPVEALTREGGVLLAAESGGKLTYVADGPLGEGVEGNRTPEWQQILATRRPEGWRSQDIAPPSTKPQGVQPGEPPAYQFFSTNLETALVEPLGNPPEPPLAPGVTQATMYTRDSASGDYIPLLTEADVAPGLSFGGKVHFAGASTDLTHVVLISSIALTGHASAPGLYEWSGGELQQVSVAPSGEPQRVLVELGYSHTSAGAVSSDGSRVIWTTPEAEAHLGHLYLRDLGRQETIQLDAAQGLPQPKSGGLAHFQAASSDGSRVFFTDSQRLTPDSTAEPASPTSSDLYECDIAIEAGHLACDLTDLTVDLYPGEHAAVQGLVLGASADATTVFAVAQGVLASNNGAAGQVAEPGANNLYEFHYDGVRWSAKFIAALDSSDSPEWTGNHVADAAFVTARTSPSGRYFAFMSAAPLTGYDNRDQNSGVRDEEVFVYDAAEGSITCVSCNPSGERPIGVLDQTNAGEGLGLLVDRRKIWAELGHEHWLAGNIPGWTAESLATALFQPRYLTDAGRLFFDSPDELVPAATNHKENVYEYEPNGTGGCESATGACVALISSGGSDRESAFIEATPSGDEAFFVSEANLLPQDTDTAYDIYDARVCTVGSPCLNPAGSPPPPCASAGTCRPASSPVGLPAAGGTAAFSGPGNPKESQPAAQVQGTKTVKAPPKKLSRAQKLRRALKSCHRRYAHSRSRRRACEARARKLYGAHGKKAGKSPPGKSGGHR